MLCQTLGVPGNPWKPRQFAQGRRTTVRREGHCRLAQATHRPSPCSEGGARLGVILLADAPHDNRQLALEGKELRVKESAGDLPHLGRAPEREAREDFLKLGKHLGGILEALQGLWKALQGLWHASGRPVEGLVRPWAIAVAV